MRPDHRVALAGGALVALLVLVAPSAAHAAATHPGVVGIDLNPIHWVSKAVDKFEDVALGPFKLGVKQIGGLIVNLLVAIADLMVPDWLVDEPLKLMTWIVAVPDWTASAAYPGINNLHDYLLFFGVGLMTAGMTWGSISALLGSRSPEDVVRGALGAVLGIVFYKYGWDQATAIVNSMTHSLFSGHEVKNGIAQMLAFAGGGAFLAAGTIFAPILIMFAGIALLGIVAAKAALILLSALVYITGGFAFASLVWPYGRQVFRAWATLAGAVFGVPLVWTLLFCVSGVLVNDAMKLGGNGLVQGGGQFGDLMSSVMLALTGIITFYLAIKMGGAIFGLIKNIPLLGSPGSLGPGGGAPRPAGGGGAPGSGAARQPATATGVRTQLASLGDTMAGASGLKGAVASVASGVIPGSMPARVAAGAAGFAREGVWGPMGRRAERMAGSGSAGGDATTAPGPSFVRPGASSPADVGGPATAPGSGGGAAGTAGTAGTAAAAAAGAAGGGATTAAAAAGSSAGTAGAATSAAGAGSGTASSAAVAATGLPGQPGAPGATPSTAGPSSTVPNAAGSPGGSPTPQGTSDSAPPRPTPQATPAPASGAHGSEQGAPDAQPQRPATPPSAPAPPAAPSATPPASSHVSDAHQAATERGGQPTPPPPAPRPETPPTPRPEIGDNDR